LKNKTGGVKGPNDALRLRWALVAAILVAIVVGIYAAIDSELLPDNLGDFTRGFRSLVTRYGAPGSLTLLYIEESGIPLPVPGDVYVLYLGNLAKGSIHWLIAAWLGIIAVVVAGSTNLYYISRRWGPRLIEHPLARAFHLDAKRIESANRWFRRWGIFAVIFGRHIPGFRVPITVVAGTLHFPYRLFVPSVAVSTAIWAGTFLYIGARFGPAAAGLLGRHSWIYVAAAAVIVGLIVVVVVRLVLASRERKEAPSSST
jgi:membrane protein DedA with SNARE-associated domain